MARYATLGVFLLCLIGFSYADQDIYAAGDFLVSILNDDGNMQHVAGIIGFDPDTKTYDDVFDGGVFNARGKLSILQHTKLGTYGAGNFKFVGDNIDYSHSVVELDDDDNYKKVSNGIWIKNGQSVRYIAGMDDNYVAFAGSFNSVEDISYASYNNGEGSPNVLVPNVVLLDSEGNWQLLDDPNNVFPQTNNIGGLAADSNGKLYIYTNNPANSVFSWDSDNKFSGPISFAIKTDTLICDSTGNLAGLHYELEGPSPATGTQTYSLYYLDVANGNQLTTKTIISIVNQTLPSEPKLIAYQDGILVAVPAGVNFNQISYEFYDPSTNTLIDTDIPNSDFSSLAAIIQGYGTDLWMSPSTTSNCIYYYSENLGAAWYRLALSSVDIEDWVTYTMTYDFDDGDVFIYGIDVGSGDMHLLKAVGAGSLPMVEEVNPGKLYLDGVVFATTVVPNGDNFDLVIGGFFDTVGNGIPAGNLVRWRDGAWATYDVQAIQTLTSYNNVIYYGFRQCAGLSELLPVGNIGINGEDAQQMILPAIIGSAGCVSALYATDNYLFVGGNFTVQIPDSSATAHGLVAYEWETGAWRGFGIPNSIRSEGDGYEILSITVANFTIGNEEDVPMLAMGGFFEFTASGNSYNNFAVLNLKTETWQNIAALGPQSHVYEIIPDYNAFFLGGSIYPNDYSTNPPEEGVTVYNYTTNDYTQVGTLSQVAQSILLFTDDEDKIVVYAGGNFAGAGLARLDYTEFVKGDNNGTWSYTGTNQFGAFYEGSIDQMIYQSGGSGANGNNGNYDYSSDGSGMSTVGIVFLTLFLVLLFVAIIVGVAGGVVFYIKRRNAYQQIV